MNVILISAVVLGLTSSLHCIGMCGPLALAVPRTNSSINSIYFSSLQYNLGRIFTYSFLGLVIGQVGLTVKTLGFLQALSIAAGILFIVFALLKLFKLNATFSVSEKAFMMIGRQIGKISKSKLKFKPFLFGLLNGLLPCGMVYLALVNAVLAGSTSESMLAMFVFGIGTLPAMYTFSVLSKKIKFNFSSNKMYSYVMIALGLLMVIRGANLDIPYLSPKVEIVQKQNPHNSSFQQEKVVMSCCKSKENCEK